MDNIQKIKESINIVDVISEYTTLKKVGNNFSWLCPFHQEKTPSFSVSEEKQLFHCFGCGIGGDLLTFIGQIENISFQQTIDFLSEKYSIEIDKTGFNKKTSQQEYTLLEDSLHFFEKNLFSDLGKKALAYLNNRGLSDENIKFFGLWFALDSWDGLYQYLIKKGYKNNNILKSWLFKKTSDKVYDTFRNRIIIPIRNPLGFIVGFGGRALKKTDIPKYLNSPASDVFNKSKILFNLDKAIPSIKELNEVIIVEGYFDAITPYLKGTKNIVATMGTALTREHIKILKRYTSNIKFCFDNDQAWLKATKRTLEIVGQFNLNTSVINLSPGKDPDELATNNYSQWLHAVANPIAVFDFILQELAHYYDLKKLNDKKDFTKEILEIINFFQSNIEKDTYLKKLSLVLDINVSLLYEELKKIKLKSNYSNFNQQINKQTIPTKKEFLSGLIFHYIGNKEANIELLINFLHDDSWLDFTIGEFKMEKILEQEFNSQNKIPLWQQNKLFRQISLYTEKQVTHWTEKKLLEEIQQLLNIVKKKNKSLKIKDIIKEMAQAKKENNSEKERELLLLINDSMKK